MLNRRELLKRGAAVAPAVMLTGGLGTTAAYAAFENFPSSFKGPVLRPGDPGYDTVKLIWNGLHYDDQPALIARAKSVGDVQVAVNYAKNHNIPIAVRSGGHLIDGYAMPHGALVLDMSLMKSITISNSGLATVQPGAQMGEVHAVTEPKGWIVPAGSVSSIGAGGITFGGGIGHLTRRYGVLIDNVTSINVVTMDGHARTCSATQNSELFWGLKGSGGNLAIMTSVTYQCRKVESVRSRDLIYPPARLLDAFGGIEAATQNTPRHLALTPVINRAEAGQGWPAGWVGQAYLLLTCVYTGPAAQFQATMNTVQQHCGPPLFTTDGPTTWGGVNSMIDVWFPKGRRWSNAGGYMNGPLSTTFAQIAKSKLESAPTGDFSVPEIHFPCMGGALFDFAEDSAVFSRVGANWMYEVTDQWDDPSRDAEFEAWVSGVEAAYAPHVRSNGMIGLNRTPTPQSVLDLFGSSAKQTRIKNLKHAWDPNNLLRYNKNIVV